MDEAMQGKANHEYLAAIMDLPFDDLAEEDREEEDEEEEEELEWWPVGGDVFGIPNPALLPLQNVDNDLLPLADKNPEPSQDKKRPISPKPTERVAKQAKSAIPPEKLEKYKEYVEAKPVGTQRLSVSDEAHKWMETRLQNWQQENDKGKYERPTSKEWYLDARVACIDAQHITKSHSEDVVKSYLKAYVFKLKKNDDMKEEQGTGRDEKKKEGNQSAGSSQKKED